MAEVKDDLPNPLEASGRPDASADDLLAQLAGEEVDRLLAEADVERPKPASPDPSPADLTGTDAHTSAGGGGGGSLDEASQLALDEMLAEAARREPALTPAPAPAPAPIATPPAPPTPAPAAPQVAPPNPRAAAVPSDLSNQLDELFAALNETPDKASAAPTPATQPVPSAAAAPAQPEPPKTPVAPAASMAPGASPATTAAPPTPATAPAATTTAVRPPSQPAVDPSAGTTPAENAAVRGPVTHDESLDAAALLDTVPDVVPHWAKPLEWINAPFAFIPDPARDFLGKVGITTLLFAAAIMAYVLWGHSGK